jgi:hypothetical protein
MADWPVNSIQNPAFGMGDDYFRKQVASDFEGGYYQSRPAATKGYQVFPLEWPLIPEAQFQTLRTFAKSNTGNSFNWWHPVSSVQYTCWFEDKQYPVKSVIASPGYRRVRTTLLGLEP